GFLLVLLGLRELGFDRLCRGDVRSGGRRCLRRLTPKVDHLEADEGRQEDGCGRGKPRPERSATHATFAIGAIGAERAFNAIPGFAAWRQRWQPPRRRRYLPQAVHHRLAVTARRDVRSEIGARGRLERGVSSE